MTAEQRKDNRGRIFGIPSCVLLLIGSRGKVNVPRRAVRFVSGCSARVKKTRECRSEGLLRFGSRAEPGEREIPSPFRSGQALRSA